MQQLLEGFVDEGREICERVTKNLLELEKAKAIAPAVFDELARGLHTMKGSAATLGLEELSELAHAMENVFLPMRGSEGTLPLPIADALLKTVDVWLLPLKATASGPEQPDSAPWFELVRGLAPADASQNGKPAKAGEQPSANEAKGAAPEQPKLQRSDPTSERSDPTPEEGKQEDGSWRVNTRQVIGLLDEVERLRELRLPVEARRREMEKALSQLARLGILSETAETRALLMGVSRALAADGEEAADIVNSMEDGLKSITTVPVRTILEPLRRAVRDLCKQIGKEAQLSVVGAEVSLDRRVLEALRGPLVHLARTPLDPALDPPDVRETLANHPQRARP